MKMIVQQKLVELIKRFGVDVAGDARRCEALLRDFCGDQHQREVHVLVCAVRDGIASKLVSAGNGIPTSVLWSRLVSRLHNNYGIAMPLAQWGVQSWALALGSVTLREINALADENCWRALAEEKARSGELLRVAADGSCRFKTITEAIKAAIADDLIMVAPGLYKESLRLDSPITIIGDGQRDLIVIESQDASCVEMRTTEACVSNLTIRCLEGDKAIAAVFIPDGRLSIIGCDLSSEVFACVAIRGAKTNSLIKSCEIRDCRGFGVLVSDLGQNTIEDCNIYGNAKSGVIITENSNPMIRRCAITNNDLGVVVMKSGQGMIEDCEISDNKNTGIIISDKGNPVIRRCQINDDLVVCQDGQGVIENCVLSSQKDECIVISNNGNPVIRKCIIRDCHSIGVCVRDSGQGLIEDCDIFGNVINIGIFRSGNPRIKSCRLHDDHQSGVFVSQSGGGVIENCDIYGSAVAGIATKQSGNPSVRRCKIHDGKGGGLFVTESGQGTFEDCDIFGNDCGGVMITDNGNPIIRKCKIHNGKANGIIVQNNGHGTLEDCEIFGNKDKAIESTGNCPIDVHNCTIDGVLFAVFPAETGNPITTM